MAKVRITKSPEKTVRSTKTPGPQSWFNQVVPSFSPDMMSAPNFETRRTIQEVPWSDANIEAEKGETVLLPSKGGLPAHYNIEGNRHSNGGTPLNVPKDSFVFSDTKKMRIKDPKILEQFGKSKGSYTPAELAKKYDINKFRKILQDPDSDDIMRSTAEKMIGNYNVKLGKLALVQEAKKGFPQGIPAVAMPYLSTFNIEPDSVLPLKQQQTFDTDFEEVPQAGYGFIYGQFQTGGPYLPAVPTHSRTITPPYDWSNPYYSEPWNPSAPAPSNLPGGYSWNYPAPATESKPIDAWWQPAVDSIMRSTPPAPKSTVKTVIVDEDFRYGGGYVPSYQQKGATHGNIVKREQSAKTGNIRVTYADGHTEIIKANAPKKTAVRIAAVPSYNPYSSDAVRKVLEDNPYYDEHPELYNTEVAGHQAKNPKGGFGKQDYAGFVANNRDLLDAFKTEKGRDYNKSNPEDVRWFQERHRKQTIQDAKDAGYSDREAEMIADNISFNPSVKKGQKDPRGLDAAHGDWTNSRVRFKFKPKEEVKPILPEVKKALESPGPQRTYEPQYTTGNQEAPYWLQDVVNTASAAGTRLGIKKYMPWAPPAGVVAPRPTFYDPTRELAANAEAMGIGTEGAGLFSGPQAYNARFSQIQGAGAKNAANILAKYNNLNVGVANQFEQLRAGIYNRANERNAAAAKNLYDQATVANQQFDNAKRQANNEIRAAYVNALTNRGMTQTLNTLYPHYQVDPSTGGLMGFYRGSNMNPSTHSTPESIAAGISDLSSRYNLPPTVAAKIYGYDPGVDERSPLDETGRYFRDFQNASPQFEMGGTDEDNWLDTYRGAFLTGKY